jgi:hypothetical protein
VRKRAATKSHVEEKKERKKRAAPLTVFKLDVSVNVVVVVHVLEALAELAEDPARLVLRQLSLLLDVRAQVAFPQELHHQVYSPLAPPPGGHSWRRNIRFYVRLSQITK